jgi:predicted permease
MDMLLREGRLALRGLVRSPRFAAMAIATLALGIGVTVAVFSLVNAVLLRPLPYRDPATLVQIETVRGGERGKIAMREIDDLRERFTAAADIAAYVPGSQYSVSGQSTPEKASAILASHNLLRVLGAPFLHGGTFPDSYDRERHNGLILSYGIWRRQFGGDPSIVGRSIIVDASPGLTPSYTVMGVMPEGFDFPARTDLYRSLFINRAFPDNANRQARSLIGIARLRPGISIESARRQLAAIGEQLAREYPTTNEGISLTLTPLRDVITGPVRPYLSMLLAAVTVVFLMALVNVANLFLSRALDRQPQLAVRRALGATRTQLVSQSIAEGLLLAIVGGGGGVLLARTFVTTFVGMVKLDLPSWMEPAIDRRALLAAIGLSLLAGAAAALVPAWKTTSGADFEALRAGRSSGGVQHRRVRRALLVAEIAVSVLLLVCAGLMLQTFRALWQSDVGFSPDRLLSFKVALPVYYSPPQAREFQRNALTRLEAIPGASGAALNTNLPFSQLGQAERETVIVEGQDPTAIARNPYVNYQRVAGRYFEITGIAIQQGRGLDDTDREGGQLVAVVSRRFAERFWPGQHAIGKRLRRAGSEAAWLVVVGVAGDVRHASVTSPPGFDVYLSALQAPQSWNHFLVRLTTRDPMAAADDASRAIWALNPQQPVSDIRAMKDRMLDTAWQQRASAFLLGVFATLALALASVGIYGVTSYTVGQRLREFGVRRALGAQRSDLTLAVLREAGLTTGVGLAAGLAAALAASRALRPLLFGVAPLDAVTFIGVPLVLSAVSMAAAVGPARRAARTDPLVALKSDS